MVQYFTQFCRVWDACQMSSGKLNLHNWVYKSALTSTLFSLLSFAALSVIFSIGSWTSPLVEWPPPGEYCTDLQVLVQGGG